MIVEKSIKKVESNDVIRKLTCLCCGKEYKITEFYNSNINNVFYKATTKIPYCKSCVNELYEYYLDMYQAQGNSYPEQAAVKRLCMGLNIYYDNEIFMKAVDSVAKHARQSLIASYFQLVKLSQYKERNYDTTITNIKRKNDKDETITPDDSPSKVSKKVRKFFGEGFSDFDYEYLKEQYDDWTSRCECESKQQEEIFKRICFIQLGILKATQRGEDTKDLDTAFQKYLETAKLQPKQTIGNTSDKNQTFGTLLDKWETTRPVPEIDEELRDVDKIGLYIDIFFRGHLAKMMGLKNGLSKLYDKFMKKYTVERPEYKDDEDNEALFDAIFGNSNNIDND